MLYCQWHSVWSCCSWLDWETLIRLRVTSFCPELGSQLWQFHDYITRYTVNFYIHRFKWVCLVRTILEISLQYAMVGVRLLAVLLLWVSTCATEESAKVTFQFPEFDYKETYKNVRKWMKNLITIAKCTSLQELSYKEFESACKQTDACIDMDTGSMERLKCVRECISPSCYREIYRINELEEGEIDVRLQSFKGCFVQRSNRSRGWANYTMISIIRKISKQSSGHTEVSLVFDVSKFRRRQRIFRSKQTNENRAILISLLQNGSYRS